MKTIELSTASKSLSEYAKEIGRELIILTSYQKPVAAIISLENTDRESLQLNANPEFMEIIEKAREESRTGKTLSFEEMKREICKDSV